MSEVWTEATICFENEEVGQRWADAFELASGDLWEPASKALVSLGLTCAQKCKEGIRVSSVERFGRRIELSFMELDLDSQKLLKELIELGATHMRANIDDSRTGDETKIVRIGKTKVKATEFVAALAEFDDDFAFITALEKGKASEVKRLLAKGISPNQEIRPNLYPLFLAVRKNKKALVKDLIKAGADLNVLSREGEEDTWGLRTPLHAAVGIGATDIIELLIKSGADTTVKNAAGETPLYTAIKYQHKSSCSVLVAHGANLDTVDDKGLPPLFNIFSPKKKIAEFLAFADSIGLNLDQKLESGENLLWNLGWVKSAAIYLEARGMVASPPKDAYTGDLPRDLHTAIGYHDLSKLKSLIASGIDLNEPFASFANYTPEPQIFDAVRYGRADLVKLLLDAGCNINVLDDRNRTLLHKAVDEVEKGSDYSVVEMLLDAGCDIDAFDERNETPLHMAAYEGNVELVRWLLDRGANINAFQSAASFEDKDDPMFNAINTGNIAVAKLLMEYWTPTPARLKLAKEGLEWQIKYRKAGEPAEEMLASIKAQLNAKE